MTIYNPFGIPFADVKADNLEILKNVAEGWFVEYKKEGQNGNKIAKSVSSFSNSYGGIYFLGIEANKNNKAENIIGVSDSPDRIRDSLRNNCNPFPIFDTYTIKLSDGNNVIMVVIPEGENPPYIHIDGRIYRRLGASSDPISENDRHTIDMLYNKSRKYLDEIEEFRNSELTYCKGDEVPHLEVYINVKPFRSYRIYDLFQEEEREKLLKLFNDKTVIGNKDYSVEGKIDFDTISTYNRSIVIRNQKGIDLAYNGLTVEIDVFGNLKLLIPISKRKFESDKYYKRFAELKDKYTGANIIDFLDARSLYGAITCLVHIYCKYLFDKGYKESVEVKLRLTNCYRSSLYMSSDKYIEHIERYGLPICMKDEQYFPIMPLEEKVAKIADDPITFCNVLFAEVSLALGLPYDVAIISILQEMIKNKQNPTIIK